MITLWLKGVTPMSQLKKKERTGLTFTRYLLVLIHRHKLFYVVIQHYVGFFGGGKCYSSQIGIQSATLGYRTACVGSSTPFGLLPVSVLDIRCLLRCVGVLGPLLFILCIRDLW